MAAPLRCTSASALRVGAALPLLLLLLLAVCQAQGAGAEAVAVQPSQHEAVSSAARGPSFDLLGSVNVKLISPQGARVTLLLGGGRQLSTFVRLDGTFTLRGVPPGVHVLEVFHLGFLFPQIRTEILADAPLGEHVKASYVGGDNRLLQYPLMVQPLGKVSYFEPRQGLSWRSFLFQPQIIMMLIMISGLFILPKMQLDPESLKEMQAMQRSISNPAQSAQGGKSRRD
eukprot:jgi/Tetstr1/448935/TSEL_036161.t1